MACDDLIGDLATLEIARAQTWQWLHHQIQLDDGTRVSVELVRRLFDDELERIHRELDERTNGNEILGKAVLRQKEAFTEARDTALEIFTRDELTPFLAEASELA